MRDRKFEVGQIWKIRQTLENVDWNNPPSDIWDYWVGKIIAKLETKEGVRWVFCKLLKKNIYYLKDLYCFFIFDNKGIQVRDHNEWPIEFKVIERMKWRENK